MATPTPSPQAPREVARNTAFVVLALIVIGLLAWKLAPVFLLLFGGILAATALRVPARLLERRLHLEQGAAVAIAVLLVIAVAAPTKLIDTSWPISQRVSAWPLSRSAWSIGARQCRGTRPTTPRRYRSGSAAR